MVKKILTFKVPDLGSNDSLNSSNGLVTAVVSTIAKNQSIKRLTLSTQ